MNETQEHRRDIDGLRAIAVIAVVLFHIFPEIFTNGFIGVDIFFVISGYLITKTILTNYGNNKFKIYKFYYSRFRRILPALTTVLTFSLIFALFILYDSEITIFIKHFVSSQFFVSNYIYLKESNYFDTLSIYKPLLHLWSLSIEVQFYLIIPFIIVLGIKTNKLIHLILFLTILFYLLNFFNERETSIFYSFFRVWEILIGSVAFLFEKKLSVNKFTNIFIFITLMLSLIISTKSKNPQFYALIPTFCTFFIICSGKLSFINKNVLSQKYLASLGIISYPLYLWHWPIISYFEIMTANNVTFSMKLFIILLSLILAYLTYRFIEKPVRFHFTYKKNLFFLISLSSALTLCCALIFQNGGFPNRHDNLSKITSGNDNEKIQAKIKPCEPVANVIDSWCRKTESPQIVLFGDSHADLLMPAFVETYDSIFSNVISIGAGNCSPAFHESISNERCKTQAKNNIKYIIKNKNIKYVVITSWGNAVRKPKQTILGHKETLNMLLKSGKKIIYIIDVPTLKMSPNLCKNETLFLRNLYKKEYSFCKNAKFENDFEQIYFKNGRYNLLTKDLKKSYPNILFFDPKKLFCNDVSCEIIDKKHKKLIYNDKGHLGIFAARIVVKSLIAKIRENKF